MRNKFSAGVITSGFALAAFVGLAAFNGAPALAQSVKETTYVKSGGNVVVVRTMAPAEVVSVEPFIDAKKGKKSGNLNMEVVLKNTANKPQAYSVFAQGRTKNGGWLGGMGKAPAKGKLDPGKEVKAKVKTNYEGASVPHEMRLDVFSPQ
jgi:hypothetical protein